MAVTSSLQFPALEKPENEKNKNMLSKHGKTLPF